MHLFVLALLLLSKNLCASSTATCDIFVALPFTIEHETVRQDFVAAQEQIKEKAGTNKCKFYAIPKKNLHITLHSAKAISKEAAKQFKEQVKHISQSNAHFDISTELHGAHLELMGPKKDWLALRLPASGKKPLVQLAERIRWSFQQQISSEQIDEEPFKAHITLGRFKKTKKSPNMNELCPLKTKPASSVNSCFMRHVLFSMGSKTTNQTTQKTRNRTKKHTFELQAQNVGQTH